jgi:hypothetical protein
MNEMLKDEIKKKTTHKLNIIILAESVILRRYAYKLSIPFTLLL